MNDATERLRRAAQNEQTVIALNDLLRATKSERDAFAARLADAVRLLEGWHTAYHADAGMEGLDDDTTTWLAGISIGAVNVPGMTPDSATPRETASHE